MRILVYPHSMELGGSQLNAIELAAATRDRGHEVIVYAEDGPLVSRVIELGLEHVRRRPSRFRPGVATARDLARLVAERDIHVIHGWEWPPILEGYAATTLDPSAVVVGSIMSMSVAPFIPADVPLTVGTERIRRACAPKRKGVVALLEPPVDTDANRPTPRRPGVPQSLDGVPDSAGRLVIVSRFATELKLEGILTAIRVTGELATKRDIQLVLTGDGPARHQVSRAADLANAQAGQQAVVLTGQLSDPRTVYNSADVCLGMGGSALRSLAFGKPLIVQGEGGFFETLTPQNVDHFLVDGWYGMALRTPEESRNHLSTQLEDLLDDEDRRRLLGDFGRGLIEDRFSLRVGARTLERLYRGAQTCPRPRSGTVRYAARSGTGLLRYKIDRRLARRRGRASTDDFNARPV